MFTVVLFEPEIPPNTGNIIRLCANTGCELRLIKPLGFPLDSAKMKRAGLDYHEFSTLIVHENLAECLDALQGKRIFALTTKGKTRPIKWLFRLAMCLCLALKHAAYPLRFWMRCLKIKKSASP